MASTSTQSHESFVQFGKKHVTAGLGRVVDAVLTKGEGSYVTLGDGRKMLDFTCGIGVTNLGKPLPPKDHIAFNQPYLELIERLLPMMPHPSLDSFFFWNSGSEAVEAGIKMARAFTGRQNIINMQGAYHGRTMGAMAVTKSKTIYSAGFHPLMPGAYTLPFPYWHQLGVDPSTPPSELSEMCLNQLNLLLAQASAPKDTAAIIIEPVLGEGGMGIMLIIDEVQCGFGRTGKNYYTEYSGVRPDILLSAKGLANGFPLSAVVSRKELTDKLPAGSMGGTYAGNAVSCAAAVASADAMKEEKILDNVNARSTELFAALNALRTDADAAVARAVLDVRGKGLMVAVEFASPTGTGPYDRFADAGVPAKLASRVAARCVEKGMLILTTSVYEVVRFIPPLNVSKEDLAEGVRIFEEAVREVVKEGKA
ncbi:hypothetical protein GSI_01464 [Ganoderma sinense ZZ0214-1]|uniref:Uncharacterized protein n=1 Tax=Ganoderma sinense ZZ0214-1 TaxID=1077348 RepID=A0A2G8SPW4_9APHY|nr:hypothetical protein GSI_01464 [Ganoderma sinense ZZ0214-1]